MAPDPEEAALRLGAALRRLDDMAAANIRRAEQIRERIEDVLARIIAGEPVSAVVEGEPRPLIVQLITENIEALQETGSSLRKAEATALRAQGYTMEQIADLFGVTRQRVSSILKSANDLNSEE